MLLQDMRTDEIPTGLRVWTISKQLQGTVVQVVAGKDDRYGPTVTIQWDNGNTLDWWLNDLNLEVVNTRR